MESVANTSCRELWNKGKIVGQKSPSKPKDIWALRVRLQMENRVRELALFNLGTKPDECLTKRRQIVAPYRPMTLLDHA